MIIRNLAVNILQNISLKLLTVEKAYKPIEKIDLINLQSLIDIYRILLLKYSDNLLYFTYSLYLYKNYEVD